MGCLFQSQDFRWTWDLMSQLWWTFGPCLYGWPKLRRSEPWTALCEQCLHCLCALVPSTPQKNINITPFGECEVGFWFYFLLGWIQEVYYVAVELEVFEVVFFGTNAWRAWFLVGINFWMYVSLFQLLNEVYKALCQLLVCMFSQTSPQIRFEYYNIHLVGLALLHSPEQHIELNLLCVSHSNTTPSIHQGAHFMCRNSGPSQGIFHVFFCQVRWKMKRLWTKYLVILVDFMPNFVTIVPWVLGTLVTSLSEGSEGSFSIF